jgi:hypothetical protein
MLQLLSYSPTIFDSVYVSTWATCQKLSTTATPSSLAVLQMLCLWY